MMRYIKKGSELLCVDEKWNHLSKEEVLTVLGAEAVFEINLPITEGSIVKMILTAGYLGVNFWRLQQIKDFFNMQDDLFLEAMKLNGWGFEKSNRGLFVYFLKEPTINCMSTNGLLAITMALNKYFRLHGETD